MTGASGLIGSHVLEALIEAGYEPRAFCRHGLPGSRRDVETAAGDIRDPGAVAAALRGCEAAIHVAAVYSYSRRDAAEIVQANVDGTRNLLDAAARAGVGRLVVTSSAGTCGPVPGRRADERDQPPPWELSVPYKASKLAAERLALQHSKNGTEVVVVNPTTTVGAGDRRPTPSGRMVRDVLAGRIRGYIASGGLNVVAAQDVARGHVLALERGRSGERYVLGGEDVAMKTLFALIARLGHARPPRLAIPYRPALCAAEALDWVGRRTRHEPSLLVLDEVRLARVPMYFSSAKAESELGYRYRPAEEALAPAVEWFTR